MVEPADFKVGELARRTGVSIRALHHYDELGLLSPSSHTDSGHRLYSRSDLLRLQQILSLRQIGLGLEEIRGCLDGPGGSLAAVLERHLTRLREQLGAQRRLLAQLELVVARLADGSEGALSVEQLIRTLEATAMLDEYYTDEQRAQLEQRRLDVGEARIRRARAEWADLIAEVRAAMESGVDPTSPDVVALARRWRGLVDEFTGGDEGIASSLGRLYEEQPRVGARFGIDAPLMEFVGRAMEASRG